VGIVALIGRRSNETSVAVVRRWTALGIDAHLLTPAHARRVLRPGDVALARLDVLPTLDGVEGGLLDLMDLQARGVHVLNPARALVNAHDKLRTAQRLAAAGVPHVETTHVRIGDDLAFTPPIVVKPRFGSWGLDVFRCDDAQSIRKVFATVATRRWFARHGAVVQPLLPPTGRHLRMLVANGQVVGAEARIAAPGEWRTNISLGGSQLAFTPASEPAEIAVAAAAAVGGDFVGVDLMPSFGGHLVLEVNAAVELDGSYASGLDVYEKVAVALDLLPATAEVAAAQLA
jgi:[lysine-biosynthesis-protein LysW]--L-2-aminoadipate ligase